MSGNGAFMFGSLVKEWCDDWVFDRDCMSKRIPIRFSAAYHHRTFPNELLNESIGFDRTFVL